MPTRLPFGLSFVKPGAVSGAYTFVAGDTTPDVSLGTFFVTASSAVTITNFDGGERGKIIIVYSNSAGATTIQNSAGGVNLDNLVYNVSSGFLKVTTNTGNAVLLNGEAVSFVHNGTDWSMLGTRVQDTANA